MQITKARETMTSKERVLAAFAHAPVDRVPIDYGANAGIDRRLKAAFGLKENDAEGLRVALGVDFRGVGVPFRGPKRFPDVPGRNVNQETGIRTRWIEHETGGYWDYCDFPLKVMGKADEGFAQAIGAIVMRHAPDFDAATMEMRPSKAGNYLSLTCTIRAVSQAQLDALYRELTSHPLVKIVL